MKKGVYLVTLILIALTMGVFWGTWFTLTRSLETFSGQEFTHIGQTIITNVAIPMRIIMPSCLVFMALSLFLMYREGKPSFYLSAVALVLMLLTLQITVAVEVPIDNKIRDWTMSSIPSYWQDLRATWQHYHAMRTFTSVAAFVVFLGAVLVRRRGQ